MRVVFIAFIRTYQVLLSPFLGVNCRHNPTCSNYAIQSFEEWGSLRGLRLTLRRIGKCHPWGTTGDDPVPKKDLN